MGRRLLFPSKWVLGSRDMFLLTLAASAFVLALTLAQGSITRWKAYSRAALSWLAGVVAFVAVVAAGHDLFLRNELAFLAGAGLSAVLMSVLLWQQTRSGPGCSKPSSRSFNTSPWRFDRERRTDQSPNVHEPPWLPGTGAGQ